MIFSFRFDGVEFDQKSSVSAVKVYYGSRADAVKSAAEVTKELERDSDFGSGSLHVTRSRRDYLDRDAGHMAQLGPA